MISSTVFLNAVPIESKDIWFNCGNERNNMVNSIKFDSQVEFDKNDTLGFDKDGFSGELGFDKDGFSRDGYNKG